MTEYIPTDTDISELGDYQDDYNSLLAKCGMLNTENEILKKQLKDEIFERDNRIQHLIFENERVKSSLESANNLLTFFQSQDNSKYKKINEQLSTKNFDLEQTNHFLKRENFSLKTELDEMKIEVEKFKAALKAPQNMDYSVYSTYQGSKGLETEGNCEVYNYVNTEALNSNSLGGFAVEGRGSLLRASSGLAGKHAYANANSTQQAKAFEDLNVLGKASSQENPLVDRSGSVVNFNNNGNNNNINENNFNCDDNEEKYMVDEKLTENDFCVTNGESDNLSNNNNANINFDNKNNNNNNVYKCNNLIEEKQDNNSNNNNNINLDDSCDSSSEEIRNMTIEELKAFIKKVKKESKDFYKKALDMLTENEMEIMKLKSEIEYLKESSIPNNQSENKERSSINSQNQTKNLFKRKSTINDLANESIEVPALLEELEALKRESFEKQSEFESEKFALQHKLSQLEINHKLIVSDYENEIYKFKYEIENLEIERKILEKDINKENHERSNMAENLEHYNEIIRNLEEQKDKSENNSRNLVENLMSEKKKMEKIILENFEAMHKQESEIKLLKESEAKTVKDLTDAYKKEKQSFEGELIELRGSSGVLKKEKELLKKELEAAKASYKNAKMQSSDLTLENAKIKEAKNDEVKKLTVKLDENVEELNAKFHQEKLNLQEKIKELLSIIDEKGIDLHERESALTLQNLEVLKQSNSNRNSLLAVKDKENAMNCVLAGVNLSERKDSGSSGLISSFNFEALNKEIENLKSKNFKLQVEITTLNNKLKVKENKIANTIRLKTEIDGLKKEKSKYKADMLELKKLYEEQINELLEKLNNSANNNNNNIQNNNNKNNEANINNKEIIEELNETILKLNYEKRFSQDQVNILTKELENTEKLKNEYITKLKEDLEQTEDIAAGAKLAVAQISFDKETEIVKYKKYCKKLKMKMQAMQSGTPLLQAESFIGTSSPDKSRFLGPSNNPAKKSLGDFSLANNLVDNGSGISGNVSASARVNASDYGTNFVSDDSRKKSFFDKLFGK